MVDELQTFCPNCGDETSGVGPRSLCPDCYLDENELLDVPDQVEVAVCPSCGAVRVGGEWRDAPTDQDLIYEVLNHEIADDEDVVAVSFTENGDDYAVTILVESVVDGVGMQQEVETRIVTDRSEQCETCAKFYGGYYEYKIQLRDDTERDVLDAVLDDMMDRAAEMTEKDREHFIADVQRTEHGFDVYVSSRTMAEELIRAAEDRYVLEKERSKELVGEEEGQRVYRSVIAARVSDIKE